MMRKIGILTYHRADNIGAVLQAYALQQKLSRRGDLDVEIIDYCCDGVERRHGEGQGLRTWLLRIYYAWKHSGFAHFRKKYLRLSDECTPKNVKDYAENYDLFLTGSDQVWNYECSGWDNTYFLDFVPHGKKNAYAASIGNYIFSSSEIPVVQELLDSFSAISVRELSARDKLREIGIKDVDICPDPVFLLPANKWKEIMPMRRCMQRYVFVYLIQQDVHAMEYARKYAQEHKCRIVCNKTSPIFILRGSPADFLSWVYYAECVVTNSFHGAAFALVFNRPLVADTALANGGSNTRIKELLEGLGAEACIWKENMANPIAPDAEKALTRANNKASLFFEKICKN